MLRRWPAPRIARRSSSPAPTARAAAAAGCARRRWPTPPASSGSSSTQPEGVNDEAGRATIAAAEPETVCVCAFGALIKEPLLSEHPMLNVHPSLLPRWRGAAPIERAIMAGDEVTGVSIMRLTAGLDSGPVCARGRRADRADRHLRHARRAAGGGRRDAADRGARTGPAAAVRRAGRGRRHLRRQAHRRGPRCSTRTAGRRAASARVRALTPAHRRAVDLADGERLGVLGGARRTPAPGDPPPGSCRSHGPRAAARLRRGSPGADGRAAAGRRAMAGAEYLRGRRS